MTAIFPLAAGNTELPLLITAFLAAGSIAYWLGWKLRIPSILLLLAMGFIAGPWLGLADPDELLGDALFPLVSAAVAIILFEGGLTLRIRDLKSAGNAIWRLTFLGCGITWVLSSILAYIFLGLPPMIAALLGALLSVTGPTVIGPMLRAIRLPFRVRNVAKWEGILIDPVGVLLAVLIFEVYLAGSTGQAINVLLISAVKTLVIATVLAGAASGLLIWAVRHRMLPEFLHNQVVLTLVLGTFFLSDIVQKESGLVTVTLFGAILANQRVFRFEHIIHFKENLRTLLVSGLFLILAARVDPQTLSLMSFGSFCFLVGLILLVRPLAVLLSTLGTEISNNERNMLMFLAPRGIVATALTSVFALRLQQEGLPEAETLLAATLLVVTGTVLFYGLTAGFVARKLGLSNPNPGGLLVIGAHQWGRTIAKLMQDAGAQVMLIDNNPFNVNSAKEEGLRAHLGNVLSDEFLETLDFNSVGWAVCWTSNNEINAFARTTLIEFIERTHIFRLTPESVVGEPEAEAPLNPLFGKNITFEWIKKQLSAGSRISSRKLGEPCKADECRLQIGGEDNVPLFAVSEKGAVHVFNARDKHSLTAGDTLIYLDKHPEADAEISEREAATETDI